MSESLTQINRKITLGIILLFLVIGGVFRFYSIDWGEPYFFHPDERNIASSVSQLRFPDQMSPNFFAYGSLPIYIIYFTGAGLNFVRQMPVNEVKFEDAIIIGRLYSAFFSILLIPLMISILFRIHTHATNFKNLSLFLVLIFSATSIGLIQYAHFATFEMWLTFFSIVLFWLCLKYYSKNSYRNAVFCGLITGVLLATKVAHAVVFVLPVILFLYISIKRKNLKIIDLKTISRIKILLLNLIFEFLPKVLIFSLCVAAVYVLTNPFVIFDYKSFMGSIRYESGVALGSMPVFYTGEFFDSIPIIYHIEKVYPFLLNPVNAIIFVFSLIYVIYAALRARNFLYKFLLAFYFVIFLSNAFMYVKWTRYLVPTLPFIYLICAIALLDLYKYFKALKIEKNLDLKYFIAILFAGINLLFAYAFIATVYMAEDTRVAARNFALQNIQSDSRILSEVYDLGIVPFNNDFRNIELYNFYDLDTQNLDVDYGTEGDLPYELIEKVESARYIILPSQRIYGTRIKNPIDFPRGFAFYSKLFRGEAGFRKIYETPCDFLCKIIYMNDPVFRYEQTANVFDRPTAFIFERNSK